MSDKAKRKTSDESPWEHPKPFRYEVRGELRHLIATIKTLHQDKAGDKKYLVTGHQPLDERALYQFEVIDKSYQHKNDSRTKLQGSIHQQGDKFIVEGFAFVDLRGNDIRFILMMVCAIFFLLFAASASKSGLGIGLLTGGLFFIWFGSILIASLNERNVLIKYLLTSLETSVPPVSDSAQADFQNDVQASIQREKY